VQSTPDELSEKAVLRGEAEENKPDRRTLSESKCKARRMNLVRRPFSEAKPKRTNQTGEHLVNPSAKHAG